MAAIPRMGRARAGTAAPPRRRRAHRRPRGPGQDDPRLGTRRPPPIGTVRAAVPQARPAFGERQWSRPPADTNATPGGHRTAQAMANRQEWEHATAGSRSLAIAADAELRRRHPHQKIEPLRSGEPAAVSDTGREQLSPDPDEKLTERVTRIHDLAAQRQAFHAEIDEHPGRIVPGEDPVWVEFGDAFPDSRASGPNAILQPPRPEIIPSARLLQLAEHDTEPDREAAD
jgi:hypothetical protein